MTTLEAWMFGGMVFLTILLLDQHLPYLLPPCQLEQNNLYDLMKPL